MTTNNDKGNESRQQPPFSYSHRDVQPEDGIPRAGLCTESRNYQGDHCPVTDEEYDGEVAKLLDILASDLKNLTSYHMNHTCLAEFPKPSQESSPKMPTEIPPPSDDFCWYDTGDDMYALYYQDIFTYIRIIATMTGTYLITLGRYELIDVPTLRQAQAICHRLAHVFKESLPVTILYQ